MRRRIFALWCSAWVPGIFIALGLLLGVPLFLRMPLWVDVTLYQVAVDTLFHGGVHYRDVFDTNLPGFVWMLVGIRTLFGPADLPIRIVDLAIAATIAFLLDSLAKRGGATRVGRLWSFAAVVLLYLFSTEMIHGQRDVWLGLFAWSAVVLRVRRIVSSTNSLPFRRAFLEGLLWGCAVWVKPHTLILALAAWLFTSGPMTRSLERPRRQLLRDLLGNLVGGALIGALGVAWLVLSGTWPHFWEVATVWNPGYGELMLRELDMRYGQQLHWFPPWSLGLLVTLPLATLSVLETITGGWTTRRLPGWLWYKPENADARWIRGLLGCLYLVWVAQGFFLQRGFEYVHVLETFLMFAVWATHRWMLAALFIAAILATSILATMADANFEEHNFVRHPLTDPARLRCWPRCWRFAMSPQELAELNDDLRYVRQHEASIGSAEIGEVAEYLRSQGVRDFEVIAWHDSPCAVYRHLGVRPSIRFMHVNTAQMIGPDAKARIRQELEAALPRARFAVSDLERVALALSGDDRAACFEQPTNEKDLLPPRMPLEHRRVFPYDQPTVFRSGRGRGRYVVHRVCVPLGDSTIP